MTIYLEKNSWFEMYFCISVFVSLAHAASNWKALNHEINDKKKLDPRNTHKTKFWTQEIPTRKMLHPQSTHEKNCRSHEYPWRNFGRTKYSQKKKFRPKNTHDTHDSTRPTKYSTNKLSFNIVQTCFCKK